MSHFDLTLTPSISPSALTNFTLTYFQAPPPGPNSPIRVLILSPTRELAAQIAVEGEKLCQYQQFRFLCVVGGKDIKKDQVSFNHFRCHSHDPEHSHQPSSTLSVP